MKKIIILTGLLLLIFSPSLFSQHKLYGIVTNEHEELLIGATVHWKGTPVGTVTDTLGRFWLPHSDTAAVLMVHYIGYNPVEINILPEEDSVWVEISGVVALQTVTVTSTSFDNAVSTLHTRNVESINSQELRKAPCCNLSESFTTNGAVDLTYADAVTGVKEIQMLGLRGVYSQFMIENRPTLGGIATPFAFEMIPGTWLSSIQLAKGASTVKNGAAGITGQVNAELVKPATDKPLFVNAFGSSEGRGELNVHLNRKGAGRFSNGLLLHGSFVENRWDMNNDNFYDSPNRHQLNGLYRLFYESPTTCGQFNIQALTDRRSGGQISAIDGGSERFAVDQRNDRVEVWGKVGREKLWGKPYNQIGNMFAASWHRFDASYGHNNYAATQQSIYWQTLLESIIGTTDHKIVVAPSIQYDDIKERVNEGVLDRREFVPGAMAEYTYSRPNLRLEMPDLVVVLGARLDWNSRFERWLFTPRMSAKYNFTQNSVVRVSAGRGYRSPNLMAENISVLASNRALHFADGLGLEEAWNYGINFTRNFKVFGRDGNVSIDAYRTDFQRQILVDVDQSATDVFFYNADGPAFANSLLSVLQYSPLPGLDLKAGYKWNDVRATYASGALRQPPLLAAHRGLFTADYTTPDKKWRFNTSVQIVGPQRLPDNTGVPHEYLHEFVQVSPTFGLWNAQITRAWKNLEVYVGGENLTAYRQHDAIIAANDPWSPYFNGSQVWAPMMGPIGFVGMRWSPSGL